MSGDGLKLALDAAIKASPFHRTTGFTIEQAAARQASIAFSMAPELMNHGGGVHAGVQCPVVTLQLSTSFLASAKGERYRAVGKMIKQSRAQLFVAAEQPVSRGSKERLAAREGALPTSL